jgi:flavin-dependent dehydrogenase
MRHYQAIGGTFYQGEEHYSIDFEKKTITLSGGNTIRYEYLIAANGAMSSVHKAIGVKPEEMGFAIECMLPRKETHPSGTNIIFGYKNVSYAWVFPSGDRTCVGIVNLYDRQFPYRESLDALLNDLKIGPCREGYKGAFAPFGKVVDQKLFPDGILLAGDAAGFVDPITGEGIYMALLSGTRAGEAFLKGEPKKEYLASVRPIVKRVEAGRRNRKILQNGLLMRNLPQLARSNEGLIRFYLDEEISMYRYAEDSVVKIISDYRKKAARK